MGTLREQVAKKFGEGERGVVFRAPAENGAGRVGASVAGEPRVGGGKFAVELLARLGEAASAAQPFRAKHGGAHLAADL